MTKPIGKLRLNRETVRRLGEGTRAVEAWTAPNCTTNYSYCTPCPESVAVCGG